MKHYSALSLFRNALSHHKEWQRAWRSPAPKHEYDVVIVGGGGHGLATAYYLAKNHNIANVAVIEKGWIGGGNTARNTTIVRADYMTDEANAFFRFSLTLWKDLTAELNFNQMFSQRGIVKVSHTRGELRQMRRRVNSVRLSGSDLEMLTPGQISEIVPNLDVSPRPLYPILGGMMQRSAGVARHDAVAWGYARGADGMGVDIIEQCQVTGFQIRDGQVRGVDTIRGPISAKKVVLAVAGHSGELVRSLGLRLPMVTRPLQAWVSEPLKPFLDTVVTSATLMTYLSQTDKGELIIGGDGDSYNSFSQRGSLRHVEDSVRGMVTLFPFLSRVKMMRQWAGLIEHTPDHSPIVTKLPITGIYLNAGWGTGGFKATPGLGFLLADSVANERMHPTVAPYTLARFERGALVPEHVAAGGYSS